jgi:hypothetical protein
MTYVYKSVKLNCLTTNKIAKEVSSKVLNQVALALWDRRFNPQVAYRRGFLFRSADPSGTIACRIIDMEVCAHFLP